MQWAGVGRPETYATLKTRRLGFSAGPEALLTTALATPGMAPCSLWLCQGGCAHQCYCRHRRCHALRYCLNQHGRPATPLLIALSAPQRRSLLPC